MNYDEILKTIKKHYKETIALALIAILIIYEVKRFLRWSIAAAFGHPFAAGIIVIAAVYICVFIYAKKTGQLEDLFEHKKTSSLEKDGSTLLYTYNILRDLIYKIQLKKDVQRAAKIVAVDTISDLNCSPKYTTSNGYAVYRYCLLAEQNINTSAVKSLLQSKINLALQTEDVGYDLGIKRVVKYNGTFYPSIIVHSVTDKGNGRIEVELIVTTDEYLNNRLKSRQIIEEPAVTEDNEIIDEDF